MPDLGARRVRRADDESLIEDGFLVNDALTVTPKRGAPEEIAVLAEDYNQRIVSDLLGEQAPVQAYMDVRPRWRRFLSSFRNDPWHYVMEVVGTRHATGGWSHVPNDWRTETREGEHGEAFRAHVTNDGFEVMLSKLYPHRSRRCSTCPKHPPATVGGWLDHNDNCIESDAGFIVEKPAAVGFSFWPPRRSLTPVNPDDCPVHEVEPYDTDRHESMGSTLNRAEARWFAGFVLRWMAADWFGLRRKLYYAALSRSLNRRGYKP